MFIGSWFFISSYVFFYPIACLILTCVCVCRCMCASLHVYTHMGAMGPFAQPESGAHSPAHPISALHHGSLPDTDSVTAEQTTPVSGPCGGCLGPGGHGVSAFSAQH